jgi:metal-responsive CopG/Arc/MetJ family transcriptional regulator
MNKILISMPTQLSLRLKAAIPQRQRSKVIAHLIELEIEKREKMLYECAIAVEKDKALNNEMNEWDTTLQDGLKHESW